MQSWDDHHAGCRWKGGPPSGPAGGGGVISAAAAAAVAASAVAVAASKGAFWLAYDAQAKVHLAQWDLDRAACRGTSAVRSTQAECPPWAQRGSDSGSDSDSDSASDSESPDYVPLLGFRQYQYQDQPPGLGWVWLGYAGR